MFILKNNEFQCCNYDSFISYSEKVWKLYFASMESPIYWTAVVGNVLKDPGVSCCFEQKGKNLPRKFHLSDTNLMTSRPRRHRPGLDQSEAEPVGVAQSEAARRELRESPDV